MDEPITANQHGRRIGGFGMFLPGVRFEALEGAGGGGGGEQAATGGEGGAGTAVVEPPVDAGGVGGGEEAAAAEAAGLTIDEFRSAMREESSAAFREMLAEAEREDIARREAEQRASASELPAWDAFNPDVARQHVESWLAPVLQKLDEVLTPVLSDHQAQRLQSGEQQAKSILDTHAKEIGEFDRDRALRESAFLMRQAEQQGQELDAETALQQAAKQQFEFEQRIRDDERAKLQGQAQNLVDAPRDPAITAAAAEAQQPLKPGERRDYKTEMRASLARMGQGAGVGSATG